METKPFDSSDSPARPELTKLSYEDGFKAGVRAALALAKKEAENQDGAAEYVVVRVEHIKSSILDQALKDQAELNELPPEERENLKKEARGETPGYSFPEHPSTNEKVEKRSYEDIQEEHFDLMMFELANWEAADEADDTANAHMYLKRAGHHASIVAALAAMKGKCKSGN